MNDVISPQAALDYTRIEKAIAWLKESYLNTATEYIALDQKMAQQLFRREIKHVLLLHIGAFDALMLPQLLEQLNKQGFKFVKLDGRLIFACQLRRSTELVYERE